ncbi:BgTH12-06545 [Blumeria graminis f. sp. triticale]|uniref:Bgt-50170 n=2 Tax=Blumeria graminis TaxID=34373 RepID=A0A9X9PS80_BLUGR|nr:BgTH12-06545 [Blumeria graminis f. sp. triticale]VCU41133.1 Bgt-50170 [Blumeria graminis f. sp. tritici]
MRRQLSRLLRLIKHKIASSACSAPRSVSQMPTPWSSRYSCAQKEASSSRKSLIEVKGRCKAGLKNI